MLVTERGQHWRTHLHIILIPPDHSALTLSLKQHFLPLGVFAAPSEGVWQSKILCWGAMRCMFGRDWKEDP